MADINHSPDALIPILSCADIRQQTLFYEHLGFKVLSIYTSPNPYAALQFGNVELHFYGNRRMEPAKNTSMCFLKVQDVDAVHTSFEAGIKAVLGKVPRSGIPRISKMRDLSSDRRFTMTDPGGNTFFIGTPVKPDAVSFFRSIQNQALTKKFTVLYDLLYSKEDVELAAGMLPQLMSGKNSLNDLDKAKLLLIVLEIQRQLNQQPEDTELQTLIELNKNNGPDWKKIKERSAAILQEE